MIKINNFSLKIKFVYVNLKDLSVDLPDKNLMKTKKYIVIIYKALIT